MGAHGAWEGLYVSLETIDPAVLDLAAIVTSIVALGVSVLAVVYSRRKYLHLTRALRPTFALFATWNDQAGGKLILEAGKSERHYEIKDVWLLNPLRGGLICDLHGRIPKPSRRVRGPWPSRMDASIKIPMWLVASKPPSFVSLLVTYGISSSPYLLRFRIVSMSMRTVKVRLVEQPGNA